MIRQLAIFLLRLLSPGQRFFLLRESANSLGVAGASVDGSIGRMEGSLNDWTIFRRYVHGEAWESATANICIDYFRRYGAGTFVDVGANIGMIFIPVVREAGAFGVAVDASPVNFGFLAANCLRNLPASAYRLHHVAVGDRPGAVKFDMSSENFGDHRVAETGGVEVEVVRFDDIEDAGGYARPILVKLDIQGYEPEFVAGASMLLAAADAMLLEYSPFGEKGRNWISEYDKALTQNFTHVVRFDEMGARALPPEASYVALTQGVLDEIKQSIAGRDWTDPKDGHENILLLRR